MLIVNQQNLKQNPTAAKVESPTTHNTTPTPTKMSLAALPYPPQNHPQENPVGKGRKTLHGRTTKSPCT
jgi:hypothetical protein